MSHSNKKSLSNSKLNCHDVASELAGHNLVLGQTKKISCFSSKFMDWRQKRELKKHTLTKIDTHTIKMNNCQGFSSEFHLGGETHGSQYFVL